MGFGGGGNKSGERGGGGGGGGGEGSDVHAENGNPLAFYSSTSPSPSVPPPRQNGSVNARRMTMPMTTYCTTG